MRKGCWSWRLAEQMVSLRPGLRPRRADLHPDARLGDRVRRDDLILKAHEPTAKHCTNLPHVATSSVTLCALVFYPHALCLSLADTSPL